MFVAVEGPDGSGKTTLCKALVSHLCTNGVVATYLKAPQPCVKQYLMDTQAEQKSDHAHGVLIGSLLSLGETIANTPGVVVVDRWILSMLVYQGTGRYQRHLMDNTPKVSVGYYLRADVETLQDRLSGRMQDAWDGNLFEQVRKYDHLAVKGGVEYTALDAKLPTDLLVYRIACDVESYINTHVQPYEQHLYCF